MPSLTNELLTLLNNGQSLVLATIISRNGSAPRASGTQMIILPDASIRGTIGGGLLEARVIEQAGQLYQQPAARVQTFHFTGKDAAASDMICGGTQEVLLEYLDAHDEALRQAWQAASVDLNNRQRGWWLTALPEEGENLANLPRWFISRSGQVSGRPGSSGYYAQTSQAGSGAPTLLIEVDKSLEHVDLPTQPVTRLLGRRNFFIEPQPVSGTVYIFGAGHVSQQLARVTHLVDFRTVVLDDRAVFANRERFPDADEIIVLPDNKTAFQAVELDTEAYVVIVTRGHLHDHIILRQAMRSGAAYIGMIGSKRKRDEIFTALEGEGFSRAELARVHAPIGLPIDADTPEEIAVSIAAELIQFRANLARADVPPAN
jgi:xanthine dehydrogenase accessory factor